MKGRGILLLCGLFVGHCAAQTPNPECHDLVALKKNVETAFKFFGKLSCTPNRNCTGLTCSGTHNGKSFKGTVTLQGCQEPVTLFVHWGNKHLSVKDGKKINVWKNVDLVPQIKKEGNVVHIALALKSEACSFCPPFKILDDQKVRVHCNGSQPSGPDLPLIPTGSMDSISHSQNPQNAQGSKHTKSNCKDLNSAERSIERNFDLLTKYYYPGSKISCSPIANCTGLNCTGVVHKELYINEEDEHFTSSATIDYCSSPATLELNVDVPKESMHFDHIFHDGEEVEVSKKFQVYITVHLKRLKNFINVTITVKTVLFSKDLVKNMRFAIDPSHCQGYHGWMYHEIHESNVESSEDDSLSKGAIAGIAVAAIVIVAIFAAFGVWLMKTKRLSPRPAFYNNVTMSDDTDPLYNDFEPAVA